MRRLVLFAVACTFAPALAGQTPKGAVKAAQSVTPADVRRHLAVIADDSMGGRDTPSRGLDLTAQYVADQFKRFGLRPGGENGTWFQRYPTSRVQLDPTRSSVTFTDDQSGNTVAMSFAGEVGATRFGSAPGGTGSIILLNSDADPAQIPAAQLKDKVVVWAAPDSVGPVLRGVYTAAFQGGAVGLIVVTRDTASVSRAIARQGRPRTTLGQGGSTGIWLLTIREADLVARIPESAETWAQLRAPAATTLQEIPWQAAIAVTDSVLERATAPNTIGILPGSDPSLKDQYIVFSGHMDHLGTAGRGSLQCQAAGADSICNGADDDGSGTVGVIELAEAFTRKGVTPKRSIIFMTVSGEEKGLWGSNWFVGHPTVPLTQLVADFNTDMIGRNWPDTIVAIGKEHSDLGATLNRVNGAHPELGMTAIDDQWPAENFYFRSDHFNFARNGIPILFFFNGVHADYHRPSDEIAKVNFEKEARIIRLVFYTGYEVANAADAPKWNSASWDKIVEPAAKAARGSR